MLFLLTLPFRIVFGVLLAVLLLPFALLFLPFFLLRLLIRTGVALVVLPFALTAAFLGLALAFVFAVLVPLLPVAFLVFCVWAVVRLSSPPALSL